MKLLFFTPTTHSSAIGRMTSLVVNLLLKQHHEIIVISTDSIDEMIHRLPKRDYGVNTIPWTEHRLIESEIAQADALIYQIGDNYLFHEGSLHWLEKYRGIVCLHDFFLGHLFWGWSQKNRSQALYLLKHFYNDSISQTYFQHPNSTSFIESTHENAPMTEWIAFQASAVVVHSSWGVERVLSVCPGPVWVVPLAYDTNLTEFNNPNSLGKSQPTQKFQILTVGHMNPNKRIDSVIKAIAADPFLRTHASYTLAGQITPETQFDWEQLAKKLGVELHILGEVSDEELHSLYHRADVICCLRKPALEGASASAIEAMLYGKLIIVENLGFYAELPDDLVFKIRQTHEIEDLTKQLGKIAHMDKSSQVLLGEKIKKWAHQTFSPENYAQKLIELVPKSLVASIMLNAFQNLANQLSQWGGNESLLTLPETLAPLQILSHYSDPFGKLNQT